MNMETTTLRVEQLSLEKVLTLETQMQELTLLACEANPFFGFEILPLALLAFPADVVIIAVWQDTGFNQREKLVGFWPLMKQRRWGLFSALVPFQHPYSPLGVPLIDKTQVTSVFSALLEGVFRMFPQSALLATHFPMGDAETDHLFAALDDSYLVDITQRWQRAVFFPAQPANSLSPKSQREIQRLQRRLHEQGPLKMLVASEPQDVEQAFDVFLRLERSGWKGDEKTALALRIDDEKFFRHTLAKLSEKKLAFVAVLFSGTQPVAAGLVIGQGHERFFWKIAHDEAFRKFSPGVLFTTMLTQYFAQQKNIVRVDSLADANHPMIDRLWRDRRHMADVMIARRSLPSWRFDGYVWLEALRHHLRRFKNRHSSSVVPRPVEVEAETSSSQPPRSLTRLQ